MKTKSKVKGIITALGIALSAVALTFTGVFLSKGKVDNSLLASADTVENYGAFVGSSNIKTALGSGQASKVYFGKNTAGSDGNLWRVLDNNYQDDFKTSSGILLFSDEYVGPNFRYNVNNNNVKNLYWYTSMMRAYLNGYSDYYNKGAYKNDLTAKEDSFIKSYLNGNYEVEALNDTKLKTVASNYAVANPDVPNVKKSGYTDLPDYIPTGASGHHEGYVMVYNGQLTDAGVAQGFSKDADYYSLEVTKDKVFLLDVPDLWNTTYGFAASTHNNADNTSYRIGPEARPTGLNGDPDKSPYTGSEYWLRNVAYFKPVAAPYQLYTGEGSTTAKDVDFTNNIDTAAYGVRPATSLKTENLIYATRLEPTADGAFYQVAAPGNSVPAYNLYIKSSSNWDGTFAPITYFDGNNITVRYSNSITDRNMVVLLSPKDTTVGGVEYQATLAMDASGEEKSVSISLPSGVTGDNYDVTVLKTSNNSTGSTGTHMTEEVYGMSSGSVIPVPQQIKITYTGQVLDDTALYNQMSTQTEWFISSIYNKANGKLEITPQIAASESIKDAATYTIRCDLKDASIRWADYSETKTETYRDFKLVIEPKEISLDINTDSTTGLPKIENVNGGNGYGGEDNATLTTYVRLKYSGRGDTKVTEAEAYTEPKKKGLYTATAEINKTVTGSGNYKLAAITPVDFEVEAKGVAVPYLSSTEEVYNGQEQEFTLFDYNAADVKITNLSGLTPSTDASGNYVFKAKDWKNGGYKLKFALNNDDGASRVWGDADGGDNVKEVSFNIKKKPLTVTFTAAPTDGVFSWQKGATGSITVGNDAYTGDTVALACEYYGTDPATSKKTVSNNVLDVSTLAIGKYKISAKLATATAGNANNNYEISGTTVEKEFNIRDKELSLTDADLTWQYTNPGVSGGAAQALAAEQHVEYNGKDYTVKLDESKLTALGVAVDTYADNVQKAAGNNYTTTVTLKCLAGYTFADGAQTNFNIKWTIDKATFDVTEFKWQYSDGTDTNEYTSTTKLEYIAAGKGYTLTLSDLPDGLEVLEYTGNVKENANTADEPSYTAAVKTWKYDAANYNDPGVLPSIEWQIGQHGLDKPTYKGDLSYVYGTTYYIKDHLNNYDPDKMEITLGAEGKDATDYQAIITLKNINYKWKDEDGTTRKVTVDWSIAKAKVNIDWKTAKKTVSGGVELEIPVLNDQYNCFDVTYYSSNDRGLTPNEKVEISEIVVDLSDPKWYIAVATLKTNASVANNYELAAGEQDKAHKPFAAGSQKDVIAVELPETLVYNPDGVVIGLKVTQGVANPDTDFEVTYVDENDNPIEAPKNAGKYTAKVKLLGSLADSCILEKDEFVIEIKPKEIDISTIKWSYDPENPFVYEFADSAAKEFKVELTGLPEGVTATYSGITTQTEAGEYKATVVLEVADKNYKIGDYTAIATLDWKINQRELTAPTFDGKAQYSGREQSVEAFLEGFDPNYMKVASGGKGQECNKYNAIIEITEPANCKWAEGTTTLTEKTIGVAWEIKQMEITLEWSGEVFFANGNVQAPTAKLPAGYNIPIKYTGNDYTTSKEVGNYKVTAEFDDTTMSLNYKIVNATLEYVIVPDASTVVLVVEWSKPEGNYVYTGEVQHPEVVSVKDRNGNEVKDTITWSCGGDYDKSKYAGSYTATVVIEGEGYYLLNGSCDYVIDKTPTGEGENPNPDTPDTPDTPDIPVGPGTTNPGDNNGNGGGGITLPDGFPLWQVCVGGASLVLGVIFLALTISNASKAKSYGRKADKLTIPAYAGAMVNGMLFGISNTWWTVIALVLAGFAVVTFILMLVMASKANKAREEYDDAKMMFLMMNKNQNGANNGASYVQQPQIDVKEIVTQVVSALLPSMQAAAQLTAGNGGEYNDAELKRRLSEHDRQIQELMESQDDDSGFNDLVEDYDLDDFKDYKD